MSIADRISSMAQNLSSAYGRIEYLGVDTSSIDKNLQNLSSVLDTVYNEYPKVSDEGVSPSITGSRVGRLNSTLKASDTTQFTTTGKQLFQLEYISTPGSTKNAKLTAGTYTIATCDGLGFMKNMYFKLYQNGSIITSDGHLTSSTSLSFSTSSYAYYGGASVSKITFTIDDDYELNIGLLEADGTRQVMLVAGSTEERTYEPYTGGIPSPNPDYPQSINVVKGNNTVEVCGIQLFDKDNYNIKSLSATTTSTGGTGTYAAASNQKHIYIPCQPNTDYVIIKDVSNISVLGIYETQNEPAVGVGYTTLYYSSTSPGKVHIKTGSTAQYLDVRINTQGITAEEINAIVNTLIIAKGTSTDIQYTPYTGTTYPIYLGGNVFDANNIEENKYIDASGYIGNSTVSNLSGYILVVENSIYRLVFNYVSLLNTNVRGVCFYDKNKNYLSGTTIPMTSKNQTITIPNGASYLRFAYDKNLTDISLSTDMTPIELCKIEDYQDKLFKAISGDTVYDSLTAEQKEGLVSGGWYKYGEIGKVVLDGSESWAFENRLTTPTNRTIISGWGVRGIRFAALNYYSDYFMYGSPTSNKMVFNGDRQIYISLDDTLTGVVSGDTNNEARDKVKAWLSTHNTAVYYILATPTITPITDTTLISQLEAWYKAQSKNGQTNILQTNADNPFIISASALKGA